MRFIKNGKWHVIRGEDYYYGSGETAVGDIETVASGDAFFHPEHDTNSPLTSDQMRQIADKMDELSKEREL